MESFLSLPICGILVTIASYSIGLFVRKLIPSPLTNPVITANTIIILLLVYSPLTLEQYLAGGNIIPVLGGCVAGSAASLFSVWILCKFFRLDQVLTMSMLPKSVTIAVALELSRRGGGLAGLTFVGIIITGIASAAFSPFFIKIFKLKDPVANGLALGTSDHAIATATAIELGDIEVAMSGLAMSIAGIVTAVIFLFLF
jgi:putative effector of murein hydrolase